MKPEYAAEFRFYGPLNDFLPPARRQRTVRYRFSGHPGVKDPIEALGVPHTEVALIVVNETPAGFHYQLQPGDRVAVFPVFTRLDVAATFRLRPPLDPEPRFVLDVNLGKLARLLRLMGFDSLYRNDYQDADVVAIAAGEGRVALTRDRRLLFAKKLVHGYWVRAVDPPRQLEEVVHRFDLGGSVKPFRRCISCNGLLVAVQKADVLHLLEPRTRLYYEVFYRCPDCRRIYWKGSHTEDMRRRFADFIPASDGQRP